jgi:hypothetical protein
MGNVGATGRRRALALISGSAMAWPMSCVADARDIAPKAIVILDFDLLDDQHELSPATVEYARLAVIRAQLRDALVANHVYRVVDAAPASALIDRYRSRTLLSACNGCELDIARALRADRVLVGWVQKVSNLILNINVRIEDAASGKVLLGQSVDLRGNTDETWKRGMAYLVRRIVDKNPADR